MTEALKDRRLEAVVLPAAGRGAQAAVAAAVARGPVSLSGNAGLQAAARAVGLSVEALTRRLWAGESLASLAGAAGLGLGRVEETVVAATLADTRAIIASGAGDGTLSRAHARWLLEGLEAGYWGGASDEFALGAGARHCRAARREKGDWR